jgi:hypothetical protein
MKKTGTFPRRFVCFDWPRRKRTFACGAMLSFALGAPGALAVELACGVPVRRVLPEGAVHSYTFTMPAGAAVVIQRSDVSGTIGLIKLAAHGPGGAGTTCTDELAFVSRGGETTLDVSDCIDRPGVDDGGEYVLELNVVSDRPNNCGLPLPCGATGDAAQLALPGEADSYTFNGEVGREVELALTDLECNRDGEPEQMGSLRYRVFDPDGNAVPDADTCGCEQPLEVQPTKNGVYTVLVGSCGRLRTGRYRVSYDEEDCPEGPTITFFGMSTADSFPIFPDDVDPLGRPIYTRLRGHGASIVLEARPGSNGRLPGIFTNGEPGAPDLQMLVSRPLGDGNPEVCDILPPKTGGVAATPALDFSDLDPLLDRMNDMGCRFDDGQGSHVGRTDSRDTCTRSNDNVAGHDFVDPNSSIQYCAILARPWAFPFGDTIVAARVADGDGEVGERREIVIRVTLDESTPTSSPTRTPTTARPTATPTIRPVSGCVADCNENDVVAVDELIRAVGIALGTEPMASCGPADDNADGSVAANELVHAVANAVGGCHP